MASIRPAHPSGPTFCTYTPNGRRLVSAGSNSTIRIFDTGSDGEPTNIDDTRDYFTAVVASNDFFITGSEDGCVCKFSLRTHALEEVLVRCSLPIRHLALSHDKQWVAVASDELVLKIVNTSDMTRVRIIRNLEKPFKHVAFDYTGSVLVASGTDGALYVYDVAEEQPELLTRLPEVIRRLDTDAQDSTAVAWHPDGRAIAVPGVGNAVSVVSKRDWAAQRPFGPGETQRVTAIAWSPNGALLVVGNMDRMIHVYETRSQKLLHQYYAGSPVWNFSWHPTENLVSYTTDNGELRIHGSFVPDEYTALLEAGLQPAPFFHDPLAPISGNAARRPLPAAKPQAARSETPDSLDEILGPDNGSDLDGFIEDDEGDGVNEYGKRSGEVLDGGAKRRRGAPSWVPKIHEAIQPGSTPWRGNRRYLCLNLQGSVWTLDQDTHHTVTVEFYDRDFQRDFHFTDPFRYDKACLSRKGTLFSCPPRKGADEEEPALLFYRPHETWTPARSDWRTSLPKGELVTAIALSDRYVIAATSVGYIRVYTLFGVPLRVWRAKSSPTVAITAWRDTVLTIGNGAVTASGPRLCYDINRISRDETLQAGDVVALAPGEALASVFFSDDGDPCIYDSSGTLLVLLHWRQQGQAQWVPLLDTTRLARLQGGRKTETYFPIGLTGEKFNCIILKGGDLYPYFPRPLLSEFDIEVPLAKAGNSDADGEDEQSANSAASLQERRVRLDVLSKLTADRPHAQSLELSRQSLEIDKVLLQLLAAVCQHGQDERGLDVVKLLNDKTGRMLGAAGKVAARFGREVLRERIRALEERAVAGVRRDDESSDGDAASDDEDAAVQY